MEEGEIEEHDAALPPDSVVEFSSAFRFADW